MKNFRKIFYLALLFIISIRHQSYAQAETQDVQRVIGPSPNVASLFKFNDQPISLYNGTTQIQIPIYTIKVGSLEIPISLMYHSAGFKVTEDASWTGLGWALNAGGAVTSSVMGLSDMTFLNTRLIKPTLTKCELTAILQGHYDSQPDMFYFNFLDKSGQFYINKDLTFSQIPYTKIKIESFTDPVFGWAWKITNTDGTVYIFDQPEISPSTRQTVNGYVGGPTSDDGSGGSNHPDVSSETWFLTQIITPTGDTVTLNYESYNTVCEYFKGQTNYIQADGAVLICSGVTTPPPLNTTSFEFQRIYGFRLKSIVSRNGTVNFVTGGNRCDLLGDKYLSEIDVLDNNGRLIKKDSLVYNYLSGNTLYSPAQVDCSAETTPAIGTVDYSRPSLNRRLMLMGVDEINVETDKIDNQYQMQYETNIGLPSKFSAQQDTWGYFNGNGQSSLLQNLQNSTQYLGPIAVPVIMGRDPNLLYAQQGILKEIVYPTGGTTQFTYELNSIPLVSNPCGNTIVIPAASYTVSANSNNQLIGTFTVNNCAGGSNLTFNVTNCNFTAVPSSGETLPYGFNVQLGGTTVLSSNDVIAQSVGNPTVGASFYLANGTYSIYSFSSSGPNCSYTISIPGRNETQYVPPPAANEQSEGGLRIKQIVHTDPISSLSITKNYEYKTTIDGTITSSGNLASSVSLLWNNCYLTARDLMCGQDLSGNGDPIESNIVPLMILNSNTNYPLTLTHGSVTGYSVVTERMTDNAGNDLGYSVYNYSTPGDILFQIVNLVGGQTGYPPTYQDYFPFTPPCSQEWQRGLLLKREDYVNQGGGNYSILKRVSNYYSQPIGMDTTKGLVAAYYLNSQMGASNNCTPAFGNGYNPFSEFKYTGYDIYSAYQNLDSTVTENFDNALNDSKVSTSFVYDQNTLLPSTTKMTNSKNEFVITNKTYPIDYPITGTPTNSAAQGILNLQQKNIIGPVIENIVQKSNQDGTNLRTLRAILTSYKPTVPLPDVIYQWESPSPSASFSPATITASSFTMDGSYQPRVSMDQYGSYGDLLQQHKTGDYYKSYVWDYNLNYPIAEVINASDTNTAYTSFEADGSGGWTIAGNTIDTTTAITGNSSCILGSAISKSGLTSSTTYIVSYWTLNTSAYTIAGTLSGYPQKGKSTGGWTYYEHQVTGQTTISISGSGHIDELRLYPVGAQMTSYTYTPLVGMTSQDDVASRITYYEYDGLQRLKRIRDQDHNILKTFDYQYQAVSGCGSGCAIVSMQTFKGTATLSYPVGVFSVAGNLLGNATNQAQYVSLWNGDTGDAAIGTLAAGADSMHFQFTLNSGQPLPAAVTGLRYYQADLPFNKMDAVLNMDGAYVDFGDGTGMALNPDTSNGGVTLPANTTRNYFSGPYSTPNDPYYVHSYPDSSTKTLTFYHNDDGGGPVFDNYFNPATSLTLLRNLRGNLPQQMFELGGSSYHQSSMTSVANITNWSTIHSVKRFWFNSGDAGQNFVTNVGYTQDFMQYNKGLDTIITYWGGVNYQDTTFKISRLKSDWNTYFTDLQYLDIADDDWNREDLTALTNLNTVLITAGRNGLAANPIVPIPTGVIDNLFIQVAAGAGQRVNNGHFYVNSGGTTRSSASDAAVALLKSKGWSLSISNVPQ